MAVQYNPGIVTDGLVLCLDAANTKSYPGTGTVWIDMSGFNNNGTLINASYNSTGNYFDNSGSTSNFFYISVPHSTSLSNTFGVTQGGWSIEEIIWTNSVVYPEADAGTVVSDAAYGSGAVGFDWNHGSNLTNFAFGMSAVGGTSGTYEVTTNITVPSPYNLENTWRVRSMVWDRTNNTTSLYINGVFIGSGSSSAISGRSVYDGGGMSIGTLYGWKHYGRRSTFKVYNRVLTSQEILQNFNAMRGRFGI